MPQKTFLPDAIFDKKFKKCRNVTGFSSYQLASFVICVMTEIFIVEFSLRFVYIQKAKRKDKVQSE